MTQEKQMPPTVALVSLFLDSRTPRWRAPLPADAGGSFVNDPRKTNATCGGACFFILDSRTPR